MRGWSGVILDEGTHDRNGVPYTDYLRKVEFVDESPMLADRPPVHVTRRVLFDGVLAPCRIGLDRATTVDLSARGGTVLTMSVHRDDCQQSDEDGRALLGDRHVLTPVGDGWRWEPEDPDDRANPWVVVSVYVAEVHVR